jgi:sulfur relay (sulfurtransferase) complex TusBCD TusD component (DsrE family)
MGKYTFVVCTEPYKYEAVDSMVNIAEAVIKKGGEVRGIFFFGSGVYNVKGDIDPGNACRNIPEKLEAFATKNNVPLAGCSTWVSFTGIKPECFIENATEEGLGDLSNWTAESDKLIVFGTGGL